MSAIPCIVSLVGRKETTACRWRSARLQACRPVWHFVFAISYAGFSGPSQVRAVASTVVASPPFSFPLSMRGPAVLATCAQEICVSNNTEKKEVVSDKCHKIRFYFPHVRHTARQKIAFFRRPAELAFSRNDDTFSRLVHANIRAAEHEALPIHAQWCTSRSSAPISLSM